MKNNEVNIHLSLDEVISMGNDNWIVLIRLIKELINSGLVIGVINISNTSVLSEENDSISIPDFQTKVEEQEWIQANHGDF